jgi:hypothetical protein
MGMDRTQAAELAGVSYGTARRLDGHSRIPPCPLCGHVLDQRRKAAK